MKRGWAGKGKPNQVPKRSLNPGEKITRNKRNNVPNRKISLEKRRIQKNSSPQKKKIPEGNGVGGEKKKNKKKGNQIKRTKKSTRNAQEVGTSQGQGHIKNPGHNGGEGLHCTQTDVTKQKEWKKKGLGKDNNLGKNQKKKHNIFAQESEPLRMPPNEKGSDNARKNKNNRSQRN